MKLFFRFVTTFAVAGMILGIGFYSAHQIEPQEARAGASDNTFGWAWSENIGWISFNSKDCDADGIGGSDGTPLGCPVVGTPIPNYGVHINSVTGNFTGSAGGAYAWSEYAGWIKFNPSTIPPGETSAKPAILDLTAGGTVCGTQYNICGWARACAAVLDKVTCEGAADPVAGGWDGWIKMRCSGAECVTSNYGVSWSLTTTELKGWAWSDTVIGWISFSSKDCDADGIGGSDGTPVGCPVVGTPIPNYKVISEVNRLPSPGSPPDLNSITTSSSDLTENPGTGICARKTILSWIYSDPDGNPQSAARVQVDESSQGNFATPVEDKTFGPVTSFVITHGNDTGIDDARLPFNGSWVWRVQVQDSFGAWSPWVQDDALFTTVLHDLPTANFTFTPPKPSAKEPIQFTDISSAFGVAVIALRAWQFLPDGTPGISAVANPIVTFPTTGLKQIILKVTDSDSLSCTIDTAQLLSGDPRLINIKPQLPKFFPVIPF